MRDRFVMKVIPELKQEAHHNKTITKMSGMNHF